MWDGENHRVHFYESLCCYAGNRDFLVLTICGGVLLGVGPASANYHEPHAENGMTYKDYHWSRLGTFQRKSTPANQVFYTFLAIEGFFMACTS